MNLYLVAMLAQVVDNFADSSQSHLSLVAMVVQGNNDTFFLKQHN